MEKVLYRPRDGVFIQDRMKNFIHVTLKDSLNFRNGSISLSKMVKWFKTGADNWNLGGISNLTTFIYFNYCTTTCSICSIAAELLPFHYTFLMSSR